MQSLIYEEKKNKKLIQRFASRIVVFRPKLSGSGILSSFLFFFSSTIREQRRRHAPHNNFIGWKKRRKRRLCVHVGPNEACTCKTVPLFRQRESHFNLYKLHLPPLSSRAENPFSREKNLTFPRKGNASRRSFLLPSPSTAFFCPNLGVLLSKWSVAFLFFQRSPTWRFWRALTSMKTGEHPLSSREVDR